MEGPGPVLNIMDLLPEVLEKIFDFLEDPDDFLAVINTWHDIMAYRRTERLFPKVLQVLEKAGVPILMEQFLTVRQVSRKWKRVADTQLDEVGMMLLQLPIYTFSTSEEMDRFVNHANSLPPGANPFVGKFIRIIAEEHGLYESFLHVIHQYGTHMKKVALEFFVSDFPQRELITQLGQHLPNVEFLSIRGFIDNWDPVGAVDTLPVLPRLNCLFLGMLDGVAGVWNWGPVVQEVSYRQLMSAFVSTYGSQLETMRCLPQLLRIPGVNDMLPNLKQLITQLSYLHNLTQEDIQIFSQVGWQLDTLMFAGRPLELTEEILGLLNNFTDTLTILRLSCRFDHNFDLGPLLNFPVLKRLHLTVSSRLAWIPVWMIDRFRNWDIAQIFPNLEELEIEVVGINPMLEIDYYIDLIRETGVFPKLKKLELYRHRRQ